MVAQWLEQARELGIANARDPQKRLERPFYRRQKQPVPYEKYAESFYEESITPAEITEFLDTYLAPVLALLNDLSTYSSDQEFTDFIVEELKDEFLYLGDVEDTGGNAYRAQYTLAETRASYRGSTDYRVEENHAYGRLYTVRHWTQQYLAKVRLFPRTNPTTHYAGVEYQVEHHSAVVKAGDDPMDVLPGLQAAVAVYYVFYIEKQARRFGW